jgi:hypothetical protein
MKLALATCEPPPGRFAYMFADPITAPSSAATTVLAGGPRNHIAHPSASVMSGS